MRSVHYQNFRLLSSGTVLRLLNMLIRVRLTTDDAESKSSVFLVCKCETLNENFAKEFPSH